MKKSSTSNTNSIQWFSKNKVPNQENRYINFAMEVSKMGIIIVYTF
jgi:hypothetical protein